MHVTLKLQMAKQPAVVQLRDKVVGLFPEAFFLGGEDLSIEANIGRAQNAGQTAGVQLAQPGQRRGLLGRRRALAAGQEKQDQQQQKSQAGRQPRRPALLRCAAASVSPSPARFSPFFREERCRPMMISNKPP